MDNIVDYLKQLDLSEVEAKLYLTLLQNGPSSVRDLAQTIDLKRTTAYFYIDQLVEKGLIMKLVKGSKKLVAANEPESLQNLVEEKIENAKIVKQEFPNILKTLSSSMPITTDIGNAETRYYKGRNGVKKIYEEALNAKEFRSYVNLAIMVNFLPDNGTLFTDALKRNKTIKMYEIFENSPASRNETSKFQLNNTFNDRFFYKYLPEGIKISATDTIIYDGNVAIINVRDKLSGVVLQNNDYYNNSKELFDLVWKVLPDVPTIK